MWLAQPMGSPFGRAPYAPLQPPCLCLAQWRGPVPDRITESLSPWSAQSLHLAALSGGRAEGATTLDAEPLAESDHAAQLTQFRTSPSTVVDDACAQLVDLLPLWSWRGRWR